MSPVYGVILVTRPGQPTKFLYVSHMTNIHSPLVDPVDPPEPVRWRPSRLAPLALAELAVLLGGQAWFVTLTWMLIDRGAPGPTIGLVLMVAAIPRAALMLVGGAITDRHPPLAVLRISAGVMTVLIGLATFLVTQGAVPTWQLAALAALIGATDAFFFPAVGALIPQIVPPEQRHRANAFIQLCDQVTQIAGPVLAGVVLARSGQVTAVAVIGGCFAIGLIALLVMRSRPRLNGAEDAPSVRRAIAEALQFSWASPDVRSCLVVAAALSLGTVGPVSVGGALLADQRFGGAQGLGILLGAFGAGAFLGVVVAGVARVPASATTVLAGTTACIGVGIGLLGVSSSLLMACAIAVPTGVAAGYLGVVATTMLQNRTPLEMQGRVSSLLMFAFFALDPISQGLSGLLVDIGIGPLFATAGVMLVAVAAAVARTTKGS